MRCTFEMGNGLLCESLTREESAHLAARAQAQRFGQLTARFSVERRRDSSSPIA